MHRSHEPSWCASQGAKLGKRRRKSLTRTLDGVIKTMENPRGVTATYALTPSMKLDTVTMTLPFDPTSPKALISGIKYNPKGQLEQINYHSGGAQTRLTYNPSTLFLTDIVSASTQTGFENLQDLDMNYTAAGLITTITDSIGATPWGHVNRSASFAYNARDELIQFDRYGKSLSYAYTEAGNFTRNDDFNGTSGNLELMPSPDTDLLPRSKSDNPYTFDSLGQLESGGKVLGTTFDSLGQLIYVRLADRSVYYGYDPSGKRIYKRIVPTTGDDVVSVYPMKSIAIEPGDTQSYVFVGDQRLARVEHSKQKWYYYLKDHLGSSDIVMDEENYPVEQMLYRPYGTELDPEVESGGTWGAHLGNVAARVPNEKTHHRFTGHYLDDETGLYYFGARYYSAELGRFVSADGLFVGSPEECVRSPLECGLYGYADNNPIKYVDSTGEWVHVAIGAAVGAVLNGAATAVTSDKSGMAFAKDVAIGITAGAAEGALTAILPGAGAATRAGRAASAAAGYSGSVAIGTAENMAKDPEKTLAESAKQSVISNAIGLGVSSGLNKGAQKLTGSGTSSAAGSYKAGQDLNSSAYNRGLKTRVRTKSQFNEVSGMMEKAKELQTTGVRVGAGTEAVGKATSTYVNEGRKSSDER